MAEYGWNMRHRSTHGLNHGRQRPYNPTQIACRLCDHVFMSTQALINHIESHMVEEESASRRQRMPSQRDLFASSFLPNFSLPTPPRETLPLFVSRLPPVQPSALSERRPFLGVNRIVAPRRTPPLQVSPMARNDFSLAPHELISAGPQAQTRGLEEPPSDCTKPYLNQLEHPIMAIVEVVDSNDDNCTISGLNKLDLALKL